MELNKESCRNKREKECERTLGGVIIILLMVYFVLRLDFKFVVRIKYWSKRKKNRRENYLCTRNKSHTINVIIYSKQHKQIRARFKNKSRSGALTMQVSASVTAVGDGKILEGV